MNTQTLPAIAKPGFIRWLRIIRAEANNPKHEISAADYKKQYSVREPKK